ncbi:LexA family transcriptional regulator [Pseudomonas aeruginosa]|uniref:LexA family transcriptional regulator n=1 Tax=Pseudomonas aeruginosa TaxID=287 RepID=UPI000EB0AB95|nr:helix-turn-helix transcriptional regulator [Pseudomonas aeruginosa]MCO2889919.1 helix-turn-helix transcriptional regulator [Pseudomonas aeruginosa]HCL3223705.1 helix-turn-helix transcriptional regulator [Pseudomonas aeruginosa]
MNRNERIARAIQLSGKTKSEIAKLCDVAPSAVTQWINGDSKSLKAESAFALAKATGFRAEWITLGSGPERAIAVGPDHNQGELVGLASAWDADTPLEDDEVELPYYSEVELAAGNGMTEVVEIADRKLRFSKDTIRSAGVEPECAAVARVRGRSMERLILDGAAIGFDTSFTHIVDGEIYAFNQDGMLRVKYLYSMPGNSVRIRSENSDEYPDEILTAEQFAQIAMLGRVFWWSTVRRAPRR